MILIKCVIVFTAFGLAYDLKLDSLGDFNGEQHKKPIPILKHEFQIHDEGYQFGYESGNGIHFQETGFIKNKGNKKQESIVQQGEVTYHDEHGNPITLTYIADENGFQPQGAHLPTPPPIPVEIAKNPTISGHSELILHHEDYGAQQFANY